VPSFVAALVAKLPKKIARAIIPMNFRGAVCSRARTVSPFFSTRTGESNRRDERVCTTPPRLATKPIGAVPMAGDTMASIVAFQQPKRAKRSAQRTRSQRKRRGKVAAAPETEAAPSPDVEAASSETLIPAEFSPADFSEGQVAAAKPAVVPPAPVTSDTVARTRPRVTAILLAAAALALAAVGITTNGWFARSLGASDTAGWLFLAIGVAADLVALVMPSCAAALWQNRQRSTSLAGWAVWAMTFVFAVTAGIGFASLNITDVTTARAARVTPAVATAQSGLSDAMAARDRECSNGVGKFCREREATVAERRQILDGAMATVEHTADPQTDAAVKLVAWVTHGWLKPSGDDFAMLRLILLALLPQIGGILLMVSRSAIRPRVS
jgi:hypothetical protein